MSERDLLPRRPFAVLPPEPGGFEAALARGRQRRRRTAGSSVLASVIAIVLGVALSAPNPGNDARLEFAPVQESDLTGDVDSPVVSDTRSEPAPALDAPAQPADSPQTTSRLDRDDSAAPPPSGTTPRPPSSPRKPAPARPAEPERVEKTEVVNGYATCVTDQAALITSAQWCLLARYTPDSPSTVSLDVCRSVDSNGTLTYPTKQEIEFVVTKQGAAKESWRWSYGATFAKTPEGHDDVVNPKNCTVYTVAWSETDNAGGFLEAGTYDLTASNLGTELGELDTATTTFEITEF